MLFIKALSGSLTLFGPLLLTTALPIAPAQAPPPAGDPLTDAQLRAIFRKYDLNNDGFLDADELARAFHRPRPLPALHPLHLGDKDPPQSPPPPVRRDSPDQIFLWALDTNFDGRVSWPEFQAYGEQYIAVVRQQQGFERALETAYLQALQNQAAAVYRRANYNSRSYASRYRSAQRNFVRQYSRNVRNANRMMAQQVRTMQRARQRYVQAVQRQQANLLRQMNYARRRAASFYRAPARHASYPHYRPHFRR